MEHGCLVQYPDGRQDSGRACHVYSLRMADVKMSESDTQLSSVDALGVKGRELRCRRLAPELSEIDTRSEKET